MDADHTPPQSTDRLQVVVMGVSGTGKSTVADRLAQATGWPFVEGDDLHPRSNIEKMEAGEPLTDADRRPWLDEISSRAQQHARAQESCVITCSALKRVYRDRLRDGVEQMFFLHLAGSYEVLEPRMQDRDRHFMPSSLLRSQFETLEQLGDDEDGAVVDVAGTIDEVASAAHDTVLRRLRNAPH